MKRVVNILANGCNGSTTMSFEADILIEDRSRYIAASANLTLLLFLHDISHVDCISAEECSVLLESVLHRYKVWPAGCLEVGRVDRDGSSECARIPPESILFEIHGSSIARNVDYT